MEKLLSKYISLFYFLQKIRQMTLFSFMITCTIIQGRNWLPNTGWANSKAARRRWPPAPSILPKTGGQLPTLPTRQLRP